MTETGWGVFDVGIDVYLRDPAAPPIRLVHALRLFPDGGAPPAGSAGAGGPSAGGLGGGPPVVAETYDELVFNELPADAAARAALLRGPGRDAPPPPDAGPYLGGWGDGEDLAAIAAARAWVAERSDELRDRLAKGKAEHAMLTAQLGALGTI